MTLCTEGNADSLRMVESGSLVTSILLDCHARTHKTDTRGYVAYAAAVMSCQLQIKLARGILVDTPSARDGVMAEQKGQGS